MKRDPLYLHEAIVVALINLDKKSFTATFDEIAGFIETHNLYRPYKKRNLTLSQQVMLRSTKGRKLYSYLFTHVSKGAITLRINKNAIFKHEPGTSR